MKKDWKLPSLKAAQIRTPQEAAIERSLFALDPQARSLGGANTDTAGGGDRTFTVCPGSAGAQSGRRPTLLYLHLWLSGE